MSDGDGIGGFFRRLARGAGRQYAEARTAYREGLAARRFDLPTDGEGRARLVCRRHAEKRAVEVDERGRPDCFDADHQDCQGCLEDVREGRVETW
jgi:hypothetical protein